MPGRQVAPDQDQRTLLRVDEGEPLRAEHTARLIEVEQRAGDVRIVTLAASTPFQFRAGQYLNLVVEDRSIPFTIASAPARLPTIELHFRPLPGNADATAVSRLIASASVVHFDGPEGDVHVDEHFGKPLTILAGGTGISQAHAIVDQMRTGKRPSPVRVVWSLTNADHAYCAAFFETLMGGWLDFEIVVDTPRKNGAVAWVDSRQQALDGAVILAGNPGFVYSVVDAIEARGWNVSLKADAFSYAPR